MKFALDHHRDQPRRASGIPYLSHLLAVAAIVLEMEASEDEAIAALLHDVVEDGGGLEAEAEIARIFGDDVARMVRANSDSDEDAKPPWRDRKEAYIASIAEKQADELRVSIADKLHNATSIVRDRRRLGASVWDRFRTGREGQLWYYRALIDAFETRRDVLGPPAENALDELGLIVDELERGL